MIEFALIVAGGQRYAIRIRELAGLEVNRKIAPVPAAMRGLLGLSAVQGQLVPVFDLAALLGAGARASTPRWMALHRGKELVGLAFDEFEGSRRVAAQAVHELASAPEQARMSRQAIRVDSALIHVLEISSLAAAIAPGEKERTERQSESGKE
ncbi:MAG: chemotaxis protein CheW [Verrucomicrobia bacterium]|nr:chemotaxis protein CheW [Verrucomicrobiota bacterium]